MRHRDLANLVITLEALTGGSVVALNCRRQKWPSALVVRDIQGSGKSIMVWVDSDTNLIRERKNFVCEIFDDLTMEAERTILIIMD